MIREIEGNQYWDQKISLLAGNKHELSVGEKWCFHNGIAFMLYEVIKRDDKWIESKYLGYSLNFR
jgi:hypothetical protein